jgi:hypothetical protein
LGERGLAGGNASLPKILILTPMRNVKERTMTRYLKNLDTFDYPPELISIGVLEGDSTDKGKTYERVEEVSKELEARYRRVSVFHHDFKPRHFYKIPDAQRHDIMFQKFRRSALAKARNYLLMSALQDEDYVLWLDADIWNHPPDIIQTLLSAEKEIVVPNCVMKPNGSSYDLNSWAFRNPDDADAIDNGTKNSVFTRRSKYRSQYTTAAGNSTCVAWRQTGACRASGRREPMKDKNCSALIDHSASGFCECKGKRIINPVNCRCAWVHGVCECMVCVGVGGV